MSEILEWRGKTYFRSDVPAEPRVGSPAQPWEISIKGNWDSRTRDLGIVVVAKENVVERTVMYPRRGGAYNPKNALKFEPPSYYENGVLHYKAFCRGCAEKYHDPMEGWRRRDEFYVDRSGGRERLQRLCKTCGNEDRTLRRHKQRNPMVA